MRIRGTDPTRPAAGAEAPRRSDESDGAGRAGASAAAQDVATVAGIPEAEITPKVRAALDRLMEEVQNLRDELRRAQARISHLEQLADEDPLVPLINRRAFVRELGRMIAFVERYGGQGSVVYFDVNNMKQINDELGHGAGDATLRHVAEVLSANVRASDYVGRLGGDEFGVLLLQADEEAALIKGKELADAVRAAPVELSGRRIELDVAYGVHTVADGERPDDALEAADHAMYAQKRRGGAVPADTGETAEAGEPAWRSDDPE